MIAALVVPLELELEAGDAPSQMMTGVRVQPQSLVDSGWAFRQVGVDHCGPQRRSPWLP